MPRNRERVPMKRRYKIDQPQAVQEGMEETLTVHRLRVLSGGNWKSVRPSQRPPKHRSLCSSCEVNSAAPRHFDLRQRDSYDLSRSGRKTEAQIGTIKPTIWSQRYSSRKGQASSYGCQVPGPES